MIDFPDMRYSGWQNYMTWVTALWMSNDECSYYFYKEQAERLWKRANEDKYRFIADYADFLKETHEDNMPTMECGVYTDLLGHALEGVNWREIAEHTADDLIAETEPEAA